MEQEKFVSRAKSFFGAMLARAAHTMAQTALAVLGSTTLITEVDWRVVASATLMAGLVSALKSCAVGMPECGELPSAEEMEV